MTQGKTYAKAARAALLDELVAATGLDPREFDVGTTGDAETVVRFPDDLDPAAVDRVVAAHDAAAIDAAQAASAAESAADMAAVRGKYDTMQARAQQFRDDAANMPPAPLTAAQVRQRLVSIENGLADLADAVAHIGRRLGKLV
jgi:hypothetical protein